MVLKALGIYMLCAASTVHAFDDLVMAPLLGKMGPTAVMLFGQGAGINTTLYQPLGLALQEAVTFPLWFGSPQW